jgi:hypothetical protein
MVNIICYHYNDTLLWWLLQFVMMISIVCYYNKNTLVW